MKLILPIYSVLALLTYACDDRPRPQPVTVAPQPTTTPPARCEKTLCDLKAGHCTNPPSRDYCGDCFTTCAQNLDAKLCPQACNDLCSRRGEPVDICKEQLNACRYSKENAICADGVEQGTAGHPCGDVTSRVACAVIDDLEAQRAIYAANPQCKKCDQTWQDRCFDSVCQDEQRRLDSCAKKAGCHEALACERCDSEANAYLACSWKAMNDPADPGGCNSGSHKCWTLPICNDAGVAQK